MVNVKNFFLPLLLLALVGCQEPQKGATCHALLLPKASEGYYTLTSNTATPSVRLKRVRTEPFVRHYNIKDQWSHQYGFTPMKLHAKGMMRPHEKDYPKGIKKYCNKIPLYEILNTRTGYFVYYKSQLDRPGGYLVLYSKQTHKLLQTFDLSHYEYPSVYHVRKAWARQIVKWAEIDNGILYLSMSNDDPRGVDGKTAFLTAIDIKYNRVLWRSDPQRSNTKFVLMDNVIVTAFGHSGRKDYLYLLDRRDGKTLQTLPLAYAASDIEKKGKQIYVATRGYTYIFTVEK